MADTAAAATPRMPDLARLLGLDWSPAGPLPLFAAAQAPARPGVYEIGQLDDRSGTFQPLYLGLAQTHTLRQRLTQHYRHSPCAAVRAQAGTLAWRHAVLADLTLAARLNTFALAHPAAYAFIAPHQWSAHWGIET